MKDIKFEVSQQELWDDFIDWLYQGVVEVSFYKKNGELRVMKCTLLEEYYADYEFKGRDNDFHDYVHVWDIDKGAWRSVTFGTIQSLEFVYPENI